MDKQTNTEKVKNKDSLEKRSKLEAISKKTIPILTLILKIVNLAIKATRIGRENNIRNLIQFKITMLSY